MLHFRKRANEAVRVGVGLESILKMKVRDEISRMKEVKESEVEKEQKKITAEIDSQFNALMKSYKEGDKEDVEEVKA
jgi:vacuolar-type H+-ATPase catalytic subunit A/Vma1